MGSLDYNLVKSVASNVGFVVDLLLYLMFFKIFNRYMELVHTDSNFERQESFFQLFSDPRSTRLTRVQLREDFMRDRDLEAIRKQVGWHQCTTNLTTQSDDKTLGRTLILILQCTYSTSVSEYSQKHWTLKGPYGHHHFCYFDSEVLILLAHPYLRNTDPGNSISLCVRSFFFFVLIYNFWYPDLGKTIKW